jgi:hypothetical protein
VDCRFLQQLKPFAWVGATGIAEGLAGMEISMRRRIIYALLPLILLMIGILAIRYGERIPINGGLGWDGSHYAKWVMKLTEGLKTGEMPSYYFKRLVPLAVVHYCLRFFGDMSDPQSIILSFSLMNLILIFLAGIIWLRIARLLEFSLMNTLLSFAGLFFNYAVLKMSFYYPVLIDSCALFWSVCMLYLYLIKNDVLLLAATILGAFVFPTLSLCGSLLYLFPYGRVHAGRRDGSKFIRFVTAIQGLLTKRLKTLFFFIMSCGFLGSFAYLYFYKGYRMTPGDNNPDFSPMLPVCAVCTLLFLYGIVRSIDFDLILNRLKDELIVRRCVIVLALFIIISMTVAVFSFSDRPSMYRFLAHIIYQSLTNPLVFILSHILYFGPSIILIIIYRKRFVEALMVQGLGIICIVYLFLFLGIGSESREFIVGLPFFILVLAKALGRLEFDGRFLIIFFLICALLSKIWFRINRSPFTGEFLEFPIQRFFMALGPWMSDQMYYLQGTVVVIVSAVLYMCSRKGLLKFGQEP